MAEPFALLSRLAGAYCRQLDQPDTDDLADAVAGAQNLRDVPEPWRTRLADYARLHPNPKFDGVLAGE